jgi:fermentation-respiration switch protein FrsA (DUF1100 family)
MLRISGKFITHVKARERHATPMNVDQFHTQPFFAFHIVLSLKRCPVFIIHGTQDEVVPFWHGQDLFLALEQSWRAKPFWVEGAGHNNIEALLRPSGMFVDKLVEFLDYHVSARRGKITPPLEVPQCIPLALREFGEAQ